jgi:protein TonB
MTMDRSITRLQLLRFLAISIALHLGVLLEFSHSLLIAPNRHLGQSVLDIQLQDYGLSPASIPPSKPVTGSPATKVSGTHTVAPAETMASSSPSVSTVDTEPGASVSSIEIKAGLHNQLLGELRTRLSHHLTYPPLARTRGWEGTVLLSLRVEPDGELEKIRLERSSGHAVLDNSALNSLKRLGNLVEARVWLEGHSLDMQIPVIFKLIEN